MNSLRSFVKSIPGAKWVFRTARDMRHGSRMGQFAPGHFYSPIPDLNEVRGRHEHVFDVAHRELPGIDLNVAGQLNLLNQFATFYAEQPFSDEPGDDRRYYFQNRFFGHASGIFLYCGLRFWRPQRVIEIGSGFSSFVMLDTNERFLDGQIQLTFIEPFPDRLRSRLKEGDLARVQLESRQLQDVPLDRFEQLGPNDLLFVDSSHVSKIGSDVNYIFFDILPRLKSGVIVHFHDIYFPFEYPQEWVYQGRFWNEAYMMRTFLAFNSAFEILIWNQYLGKYHSDKLAATMPLCLKGIGSSLYLVRK
jgi:predicted O-methyltransferase YrrM